MLLEGRNAVIYGGGGAIGGAVARIRVLTLQTGGVPESISEDVPAEQREAITAHTVGRTMLGRAATLEDVGNVAALAASDRARAMTATSFNITCGSESD